MTLEPVEQTAASESSWVDAVGDDPSEIGRALLAQGERVLEEVRKGRSDAAKFDERLDAVEKDAEVAKSQRADIREHLAEIRARLDRPGFGERAFEAIAAGFGKFLDNKTAVVVALGILAAGVFGLSVKTPLGSIGAGDGDDVAKDDTDDGDLDAFDFPTDPEDDGAVAGD